MPLHSILANQGLWATWLHSVMRPCMGSLDSTCGVKRNGLCLRPAERRHFFFLQVQHSSHFYDWETADSAAYLVDNVRIRHDILCTTNMKRSRQAGVVSWPWKDILHIHDYHDSTSLFHLTRSAGPSMRPRSEKFSRFSISSNLLQNMRARRRRCACIKCVAGVLVSSEGPHMSDIRQYFIMCIITMRILFM